MMTTVYTTRAVELVDDAIGEVRGHVFLWGDTDHRDAYQTYFDRARPPELSLTGDISGRDICYEHGMDDVIGKAAIGTITRTWFDDIGLAFEGRLDRSHPAFTRFVAELRAGELKTSSSSGEHMADFYEDGAFRHWTLLELSLTKNPAEAQMPAVQLIRSTAEAQPDVASGDTQNTEPIQHEETTDMDMTQEPRNATSMIEEMVAAGYSLEDIMQAVQQLMGGQTAMSASPDARSLAEQLLPVLRSQIDANKRDRETEEIRKQLSALQSEIQAMRNAPPEPNTDRFVRKSAHISVSEDLKYAHLSAEQMALGVKLVRAGLPAAFRNSYKLGDMVNNDLLSEQYIRTMAFKANEAIRNLQPRNRDAVSQTDIAMLRSSMPFRADELHATDIATHGAEWVETFYDTTLWERARDRTELFSLLQSRGMEIKTIADGANTMNVKTNTASGTVYSLGEGGSLDATGRPEVVAKLSQITTGEVEEAVGAHVLAQGITFFLEEDSIINILSWLPGEMETTLAESLENTLLNGDKTTTASSNINLYDGTPGTGLERPAYLAWDGIRHNVLVDNTTYGRDAAAALSIEDFEDTLALFPSAISGRTNQILFVIDKSTQHALRKLPELLTRGVAGEGATIYSGDIPPLFGSEIYMSGQLGLTFSTGKISATAGNNTKGQIYAIYAPYWVYGRKRAITIEQDRFAMSQATVFVATVRHAFKARGAAAAAGSYNITV